MKLFGGRINIPWVHAYRADHERNQSGRFEIHFGDQPQRRNTANAVMAPRTNLPVSMIATTTSHLSIGPNAPSKETTPLTLNTQPIAHEPPAETNVQDVDEWESIHSLMNEPPADSHSSLTPGAVVELAETNPAASSLELGLMQRSFKKDPQVCKVLMREVKTIDVAPGEPKQMFTFGLGGCIAVSILSKQEDGTISATMSHRPPEELETQLQEIQQELARHRTDHSGVGREILILAPGGYKETEGKRELQPALTAELAEMVRMLNAKLPGITPILVSYHPRRPSEHSDALVIDFPERAGHPVLYKGIHNGECGL
jgi:hypothetical protein